MEVERVQNRVPVTSPTQNGKTSKSVGRLTKLIDFQGARASFLEVQIGDKMESTRVGENCNLRPPQGGAGCRAAEPVGGDLGESIPKGIDVGLRRSLCEQGEQSETL